MATPNLATLISGLKILSDHVELIIDNLALSTHRLLDKTSISDTLVHVGYGHSISMV